MFWIDLVARCCKSGMRALSCLAERVGSLLMCFLMAVRVAWLTVDFLPVPIFHFDTGKEELGGVNPAPAPSPFIQLSIS